MDVLSGAVNAPQQTAASDEDNYDANPAIAPDPGPEFLRAAEALWGKDFVGQLAAQLEALDGPDQQPDLFALATSLPFDETRTVVREKLSDAWHDGVALSRLPPFTSAGMRDPGMLLVLKSLPREDVPAPGSGERRRQFAKATAATPRAEGQGRLDVGGASVDDHSHAPLRVGRCGRVDRRERPGALTVDPAGGVGCRL